jgi:hypothetical protein
VIRTMKPVIVNVVSKGLRFESPLTHRLVSYFDLKKSKRVDR